MIWRVLFRFFRLLFFEVLFLKFLEEFGLVTRHGLGVVVYDDFALCRLRSLQAMPTYCVSFDEFLGQYLP